jgi:hypothetical protein
MRSAWLRGTMSPNPTVASDVMEKYMAQMYLFIGTNGIEVKPKRRNAIRSDRHTQPRAEAAQWHTDADSSDVPVGSC